MFVFLQTTDSTSFLPIALTPIFCIFFDKWLVLLLMACWLL